MYGGMTRRMKAHVSTMLTESDWSIALRVGRFKGAVRPTAWCKTTNTLYEGLFVLTARGRVELPRR